MAMVINSNIQSLNAQRHLNNSLSAQNTATERLSSGLRINSAKDDAAGLAIANRMTSQVKGLNMAIRNANDGVSMIQTAEGALSETTNILQRMRELSIQSANGIYDEGNRGTLNAEVQQLKAEVDRISETTSFNGLNILDGSLGKVGLQIGEQANQTIDLNIQKMDTKTLGMGSTSIDVLGAATTEGSFTGAKTLAYNDVLINGQSIVKLGETFDGANATTGKLSDLLEKINTNVTGVTASAQTTVTATAAGDGVLTNAEVFTISVTDTDDSVKSISVKETENLQELVDKINDEGNGLVSASITDKGLLSITAENSANITIADIGGAGGTAITTPTNASIALKSDNGDPITVERGSSGTLEDLKFLGFRESNSAGTIEGTAIDGTQLAAGDVTINGVDVGRTDTGSLEDKLEAINKISEDTGVKATAFTSISLDFSGIDAIEGNGTIKLNGVDIAVAAGASGQAMEEFLADVNGVSSQTGITASIYGDRMVLEGNVGAISITAGSATGTDAPHIVLADDTTAANIMGVQSNTAELAGTAATDLTAAGVTVAGGIKLESDDGSPISVSHKTSALTARTGLVDANSTADGKFGAGVNSLDISTAAGANKAIEILDVAIQTVSDVRGDLGAVTNRLDHTVKNLSNVSENAAAARSRIMDSDFAAESANLSRAQVLQQAGNAMLAQANSRPQQVLSLLQ